MEQHSQSRERLILSHIIKIPGYTGSKCSQFKIQWLICLICRVLPPSNNLISRDTTFLLSIHPFQQFLSATVLVCSVAQLQRARAQCCVFKIKTAISRREVVDIEVTPVLDYCFNVLVSFYSDFTCDLYTLLVLCFHCCDNCLINNTKS